MLREKEEVERKIAARQLLQSTDDVIPQEPFGIGFIVRRMPHPAEFWMALQLVERAAQPGRSQIDPRDYAQNEFMPRCQIEQPLRFAWDGRRLHRDRSIESIP